MRAIYAFFISAVMLISTAEAQTPDADFQRMMSGIVNGSGNPTVTANATGVIVSQGGTKEFNTKTGKVLIPYNANASVSKAALAAKAAKALRTMTALGAAMNAYDMYQAYEESGLQTCAPPDFFCKPSPNAPPATTAYAYLSWSGHGISGNTYPSEEATCKAVAERLNTLEPSYAPFIYQSNFYSNATQFHCRIEHKNGSPPRAVSTYSTGIKVTGQCATNYVYDGSQCVYQGTIETGGAYTESELATALEDKINTDFFYGKKYYDAMQADKRANPTLFADPMLSPNTALDVQVQPATSPEVETKRRTITRPDGTTETHVEKQRTTVTPNRTGTTVGDTNITYNITNTTTTTIIDNSTGDTTTEVQETPEPTEETPDPCEENPNRLSCAELGEPDPEEEIPEEEFEATYTPIAFASNAQCPAPITFDLGPFGGNKALNWTPFCDVLAMLRWVILALASVGTAFIYVRGMQTL